MQDQQGAALFAWLHGQGGIAPSVATGAHDGLRGAVATRDLAAGMVVLHAPRHVVLSLDSVVHSPIGLRLARVREALCSHSLFAVFLVDTRRNGGFWRPMVDAMPDSFPDLPACFDRADWDMLAGSQVQPATRSLVQRMRCDFRIVKASLPRELRPSLREFAWGWWASITRSFSLDLGGAEHPALVPLVDMFNHSPDNNCDVDVDAAGGLALRARRPIAAGEALTLQYGPYRNVDLLSRYGFCVDSDDNDVLRLTLTLPPSHFVHELMAPLQAGGAHNQFEVSRTLESPEMQRLLSFLRVSSLPSLAAARTQPEASEGNGLRVPLIDPDNERHALGMLARACEARLCAFGGSLEEDERLLAASAALSSRQRCAVRVRLGEKRLLRDCIAWSRGAIDVFGLPAPARHAALEQRAQAGGAFHGYFSHALERLAPRTEAVRPFTKAQAFDVAYHIHSQSHLTWHRGMRPKVFVKGQGTHLWDEDGRRYLDGMSGLWCVTLGYGEPRLVAAATRQLERLPFQHTFGDRTNEPVAELAQRLVAAAPVPMAKAFFATSGSEANETAIKMAWRYWAARGQPGRRKVIARQGAYHGSTVATTSLTGLPSMYTDFGVPLPGFLHVGNPHHYRHGRPGESEEQFGDRLAAELELTLEREGPDTVAAFFAEPVMGAGGVIVPPAGYMAKMQAVLQRHGVLLVADEVVCGFGRTGRYWGSELAGMQPDMLVCAKGLTSGYAPMSAVLVSQRIFEALRAHSDARGGFTHGFTQSGNPVAAAVALEVMKIYEERAVCDHVVAMGERLGAGLRALAGNPMVGEVRGVGLMWAIELVGDKATKAGFDPAWGIGWEATQCAEAHGLIVRAGADNIIIAPPLVSQASDIDQIVDSMAKVLAHVSNVIAARQAQFKHAA